MRNFPVITTTLLAAAFPLAARAQDSIARAAETIAPADLARHIGVIAHDSMGGRATPSPGLEATARYVADQFQTLGLKPGGDNDTWFQRYPIPGQLDVAGSRLVLTAGGKQAAADLAAAAFLADHVVPKAQASDEVILIAGRHTPESLQQASLRNKTVLYAFPSDADPTERAGIIEQLTSTGNWVVILSERDSAAFAEQRRAAHLDPTVRRASGGAIYVQPDGAPGLRDVLAAAGIDLARIRADSTPIIRPLADAKVSYELAYTQAPDNGVTAPNTIGILEGTDPKLKREYVVISAHMDDLGLQDSLGRGTDDNASGTAGLIALAKAFSQPGARPRRSIAFLATSGGAQGSWGSTAFTEQLRMSDLFAGLFGGGALRLMGSVTTMMVQVGTTSDSTKAANKESANKNLTNKKSAKKELAKEESTKKESAKEESGPSNPTGVRGGIRISESVESIESVRIEEMPGGETQGQLVLVFGDSADISGDDPDGKTRRSRSRPSPVRNVVANVNLDMIGREAEDSVTISGMSDMALATPAAWIAAAHPELRLTVVDGGTAAVPSSDHFPFIRRGIPSLHVHNGIHQQGNTPAAIPPAKLDTDQEARILRLTFHLSRAIANADKAPQWSPEGRRAFLKVVERE